MEARLVAPADPEPDSPEAGAGRSARRVRRNTGHRGRQHPRNRQSRRATRAGAIYSYFESKEAIYGALLGESLERLNAAVSRPVTDCMPSPADLLKAKAGAWFGFCGQNPRELDLGFYLVRGCARAG